MTWIIWFAIGFVCGWLSFARPQWVTDLIDKARERIGI